MSKDYLEANFIVFAQEALDPAKLLTALQRLNPSLTQKLSANVTGFKRASALTGSAAEPTQGAAIISSEIFIELSWRGAEHPLHLVECPANQALLGVAEKAEQTSQAWGMSLLAARCANYWEFPRGTMPDALCWLVCAWLAGVALGPVLTPDQRALLGVRGARLRAGY